MTLPSTPLQQVLPDCWYVRDTPEPFLARWNLIMDESFFAEHYSKVLGFLGKFGIDEHTAEDLAQDSVVALLSKYHDRPAGERRMLLFTCAKNALVDMWRKHPERGRGEAGEEADEHDAFDPEGRSSHPLVEVLLTEQCTRFREVFWDLPQHHQRALLLKYVVGVPVDLIARMHPEVEEAETAVMSRLARARKALRDALVRDGLVEAQEWIDEDYQ